MLEKQQKRYRRHKRVRAKVFGTAQVPRLCVFRSNKHIYAQLIDDEKGQTIAKACDLELKKSKVVPLEMGEKSKIKSKTQKEEKDKKMCKGKIGLAFEVGKLIAKKAMEKKIKKVVFDRGGYKYHGRVKALAEGAREGGLKF